MPVPAAAAVSGERAGQAGAAEVLDADDQPRVVQLQARLDEQLLHERVAHLHARPALLAALVERRAGQHGDPADAVPAGLGAHEDDDVAGPAAALFCSRSTGSTPTQSALTSGLPW